MAATAILNFENFNFWSRDCHRVQHLLYARFYELGLTSELTNPRVGVIPSLILV